MITVMLWQGILLLRSLCINECGNALFYDPNYEWPLLFNQAVSKQCNQYKCIFDNTVLARFRDVRWSQTNVMSHEDNKRHRPPHLTRPETGNTW